MGSSSSVERLCYSAYLGQAHELTPIGGVPADAGFDSERNHTFCRQQLQANSVIPAKRRSSCRASGVRLQMRENFPTEQYGKRSLIETVFSVVKRKLSCRAPGRTIHTQSRQALLLGLAFNLYRLRLPVLRQLLARMSTEPTGLINHLHQPAKSMKPALLAGPTAGAIGYEAFMRPVVSPLPRNLVYENHGLQVSQSRPGAPIVVPDQAVRNLVLFRIENYAGRQPRFPAMYRPVSSTA
jgi:hypothetical protein